MKGLIGVIERDVRVTMSSGNVAVKLLLYVAVIVTCPVLIAFTKPFGVTVAKPVLDELQVAEDVTSLFPPLLSLPDTKNWFVEPTDRKEIFCMIVIDITLSSGEPPPPPPPPPPEQPMAKSKIVSRSQEIPL